MKRSIKKIMLVLAICLLTASSVFAGEYYSDSWAISCSGELDETKKVTAGYEKRTVKENSLGEADATGKQNEEGTFTGIGYFGENGIEYTFDKDFVVNNPDKTQPDLVLREITWDNNSNWIGEGVAVWAMNFNGTGEEKLVAYIYNKTAEKRVKEYNLANGTDITLEQIEGATAVPELIDGNVYQTDIYFSEDFQFCDGFRVVDITEELKKYGGKGQDSYDGFDLDAIMACVVTIKKEVKYYIEQDASESEETYRYNEYPYEYDYTVEENMFTKEGYEFVAWATEGTGNVYGSSLVATDILDFSLNLDYYEPGYEIKLTEDYTFYGIWKEVVVDEESGDDEECQKPDDKPGCDKPQRPGCQKPDGKPDCDKPQRPDCDKKDKDEDKECGKIERPNCDKQDKDDDKECGKIERPNWDKKDKDEDKECGKTERPNWDKKDKDEDKECGKTERPNCDKKDKDDEKECGKIAKTNFNKDNDDKKKCDEEKEISKNDKDKSDKKENDCTEIKNTIKSVVTSIKVSNKCR